MGGLKTLKLKLLKVGLNTCYQICYYVNRGRQQQITFATMRSTSLTDNLQAVYQTFERANTPNLKVSCYHYDHSFKSKLGFLWASLRALNTLSRSELFIVDDYFFPLYAINKQPQNKVVQLWHAVGTLKKFGLSLPGAEKSILKPHTNYDWVFINSEENRAAYEQAFEIDSSRVLVTGAPMLDALLAQSPQTLVGPKRLLYSPTYRPGSDGEQQVLAYVQDFVTASQALTSDWDIYISLHPYLSLPALNLPKNYHIFQDAQQVKALMPSMALFITDYSSLSLNFSYFERPILLLTPDYQDYLKKTGFYVDYYQAIGAPHFDAATQLVKFINQELSTLDLSYVSALKASTFAHQDRQNSQRVYDYLSHIIKSS